MGIPLVFIKIESKMKSSSDLFSLRFIGAMSYLDATLPNTREDSRLPFLDTSVSTVVGYMSVPLNTELGLHGYLGFTLPETLDSPLLVKVSIVQELNVSEDLIRVSFSFGKRNAESCSVGTLGTLYRVIVVLTDKFSGEDALTVELEIGMRLAEDG